MTENTGISNKEALRDKIHEIHNYLRNNGAGYGMNALKVFNVIYGLKKLEESNLLDKIDLKRPECEFSYILRFAEAGDHEKVAELLLRDVLDSIAISSLRGMLFYEIPMKIKGSTFSHLFKEINKITSIERSCNVQLSGKIYEYFIGRDDTAISELGAYFTDRHIVNFIYDRLNPDSVESFIDPFGGSGGFSTGYVNYLNERLGNINWAENINKISHYDINEDVLKSAGLEIFCLTGILPDMSYHIAYKNSFKDAFCDRKFHYVVTNPPYGGDKTKKSDDVIKRDKLKEFIDAELKIETDMIILADLRVQLEDIKAEEKADKISNDSQKVTVATSDQRIIKFARINNLKGNDKESVSLMLMMDLLEENGTCIGVLKEGLFFNKMYKDLRKHLILNFNVREVISVPSDQFENTTTKTSIIIFDNTVEKTSNVHFYNLIVERYETDKFARIGHKYALIENKNDIFGLTDELASTATLAELLANDCSLNGKEYSKKELKISDKYIKNTFEELCIVNYGDRIVKAESEIGIYPVYGGGNITFYVNKFNRNGQTLIMSRYAISNECVRLLNIDFYLNDSGMSIKCKNINLQKFINYYLLSSYIQNTIFKSCISYSVQKNINMKLLNKLIIPIPKDEKYMELILKNISEHYDAYILYQQKEKELDTQIQEEIKNILDNEDCEEKELQEICDINNQNIKKFDTSYGQISGIYKFHTGGLNTKLYCDTYNIEEYVIIINKTNGTGNCNIFLDKKCSAAIQTYIIQSKYNNLITRYIYHYLLNSIDILEYGYKGSCQKHLSNTYLSSIKLFMPKDIKKLDCLNPMFENLESIKKIIVDSETNYKKLINDLVADAILPEEKVVVEPISEAAKKPRKSVKPPK